MTDSLSARRFLGLAVNEAAPAHSTLTAFRRRIIHTEGEERLQELLVELIRQAVGAGVEFGQIQVADCTHTVADVNVAKDDRRHKE